MLSHALSKQALESGERALRRTKTGLRLFLAALAIFLVLAALSLAGRDAKAAGSEAARAAVFFENQYNGALISAQPLSASLTVEGAGPRLNTTLRQTFVNSASRALAGFYLIRLSEEAELNSIDLQLGGATSEGEHLAEHQLSALYIEAASHDPLASLVTSAPSRLHAVEIPLISPGQTVTLVVRFSEPGQGANDG